MKLIKAYNKVSLIVRIICGLLIGVLLGLAFDNLAVVTLLGTVFVSALKAIAPILVFVLVISALAGGNDKLDRRFGLVIAFYLVSTLLASVVAVVASYILSRKTLKPIILSWNKQTEFVQNASHELRTPLTIIQAKQELLLDEPQAKIIDKVEEINTSISETRRMARLVKDLMQLAKADSNKIELQKEQINIDELIEQVTKPFIEMAKIQNKKFELNLKYCKNIKIDKNKIHQVLVIVLDNALKYTEKADKITVETYEKDSKCVLQIKDTGIGISNDGIEHIFDRFYREDKARSRETGGSGLGLSIASHIIELHGGSIKAKHNTPKGTIIEIKLK